MNKNINTPLTIRFDAIEFDGKMYGEYLDEQGKTNTQEIAMATYEVAFATNATSYTKYACTHNQIRQLEARSIFAETIQEIGLLMEIQSIGIVSKIRVEQVLQHGFTVAEDVDYNANEQLKYAAMYLLTGSIQYWPTGWALTWKEKFDKKRTTYPVEALAIASALLMAEIDVIKAPK